ncbi:MAG: acetyl-CoA carboxylase biotin carboxyl carrier protein [Chloroflexota bacterium]|nr:acetyl-CoA carboxylase biotin carboxyl carrier protein [Chloroflexota bacterium]
MPEPGDKVTYQLTFQDVIRILQLVDRSPFGELRVEMDGFEVQIVRDAPASGSIQGAQPDGALAGEPAGGAAPGRAEAGSRRPSQTRAGTPVTAPLAGMFYRSPYPGEPPYVQVGAAVKEGDVIGILEVMKLMNLVKSPCDGTVVEICAANEQFVESGEVLAVVGAAGAAPSE